MNKNWKEEFYKLWESLGEYNVEYLTRSIEDRDTVKITDFINVLLNENDKL